MSANSFNASNLDELDVLLDLRNVFLPFERAAPSAADPEKNIISKNLTDCIKI